MKLKLRNKVLANIENISELEIYIKNNLYVDFKNIPDIFKDAVLSLLNETEINKTAFNKRLRSIFSENGTIISKYQKKYWINRGYEIDEIDDIISTNQKINSPRSVEYWISNGYSYKDAEFQVSSLQKKFGDVNKNLDIEILRDRSIFSEQYWINRYNYSDDDARQKVSEIQTAISKKYWRNITNEHREKHIHKGEQNGMYGKPSPLKSGNGYKGWYNGKFFRSLRELNYMVNVLDRRGILYETAESKKYRINYIAYNGNARTYVGDFIVDNKYYVELKPKSLHNTEENKIKRTAAIEFCKNNGLIYKITDCGIPNTNQLLKLIESGTVILTKTTENKLNQYLLKN